MKKSNIGVLAAVIGARVLVGSASDALACGCFAPPLPSDASATFAVNQQAEQIIFEVSGEEVSAHVRILYSGDPEQFAWLLPMPNVPDLELSNGLLFGLIDQQTSPLVNVSQVNLCPQQKYACRVHSPCSIPGPAGSAVAASSSPTSTGIFAPGAAPSPTTAAPAVQVLAQQRIGSYETITFAADEADLAIQWLNDNGFIVNETMSPYMQPFLDADMVFVASKLVPGADLDEIRPLKLTYQAESASIPLQLTAIAAEPHMMVSAFIYSDTEFSPAFMPLVELPSDELSSNGRSNYPMLLSKVIDDEGGGAAFVKEYVGSGPVFQDTTGCCSRGDDWCGVGGDAVCQCPETDFDLQDCAEQEELTEAAALARQLATTYPVFTRISTRVSPEEMTFNPEFVPTEDPALPNMGRLTLSGKTFNLAACEAQVVDQESYEKTKALTACSGAYCDFGECVTTPFGAGCACDEGFVARVFTDSDGLPSITCVPAVGTVDFAAGGIDVPDACAGFEPRNGTCVDVGGFVTLACEEGFAAAIGPVIGGRTTYPSCVEIEERSGGPGATNHSRAFEELDVCAPPPPSCPANGWLEEYPVDVAGVDCGDGPDPSWFEVPPEPDCSGAASVLAPVAQATPASAAASAIRDTSEPRPELEPVMSNGGSAGDAGCSFSVPGASRRGFGLWLSLVAAVVLGRFERRRGGPDRVRGIRG